MRGNVHSELSWGPLQAARDRDLDAIHDRDSGTARPHQNQFWAEYSIFIEFKRNWSVRTSPGWL